MAALTRSFLVNRELLRCLGDYTADAMHLGIDGAVCLRDAAEALREEDGCCGQAGLFRPRRHLYVQTSVVRTSLMEDDGFDLGEGDDSLLCCQVPGPDGLSVATFPGLILEVSVLASLYQIVRAAHG